MLMSTTSPAISISYMVLLVFFGAFFVINLLLAVIFDKFDEIAAEERERASREARGSCRPKRAEARRAAVFHRSPSFNRATALVRARTDFLYKRGAALINSTKFDLAIIVIISANTLVMALDSTPPLSASAVPNRMTSSRRPTSSSRHSSSSSWRSSCRASAFARGPPRRVTSSTPSSSARRSSRCAWTCWSATTKTPTARPSSCSRRLRWALPHAQLLRDSSPSARSFRLLHDGSRRRGCYLIPTGLPAAAHHEADAAR